MAAVARFHPGELTFGKRRDLRWPANFTSLMSMSSISSEAHTRIPATEIGQALDSIASQIANDYSGRNPPLIVGIARGGVPVAKRLASLLEKNWETQVNIGQLDISFHRDDINQNPIPKSAENTELPFDVEEGQVILVDDVIFSGRTIRAALNELFDLGRPANVKLAVLFDRGGRCLPIQPDYTGFHKQVSPLAKVVVQLDSQTCSKDEILIVKPA